VSSSLSGGVRTCVRAAASVERWLVARRCMRGII
jgi:hypothetical protein